MSDNQASQDTTEDVQMDDKTVVTEQAEPNDDGAKSPEDTFYPNQKDESGESDADQKPADDDEPQDDGDDSSADDDESTDDKEKGDEPGEYKLAKPKDSRLTDADMERIESFAKDQGLSKDAAEKLVASEHEARDHFLDSLQTEHKQVIQQWVDDVKADKELGGEKFGQSAEYAKSVVDRFGTDEFRKALNDTGYGNNPEVVRIFARIGRAMAPDTIVKENNPSSGTRSLEDTFYPNQPN